jgi:GPH family glycoside/pentoside/hexuronide:cation symporter
MSAPTQPAVTVGGGKAYTAPASEIWSWGIGAVACHALIQTYGQASTIFTVGFGLSPVIISWCMMLPRVVDGIMDPIIGHLSDETHTRWGRRKPYLVLGSVLGAIFLMAVWWANPAWSHTAQFVYLLGFGTLFYIAYGIYTMAWTAIGYELTDDYNERSKVAAIGGLFLAVVTLGCQWMYWLALRPIFGPEIDASGLHREVYGMRWISTGMAVLIVACAFVTTWFCKERFTQVNRAHVPILPALKTTVKNRPFLILIGFKICQILGERAALGLLVYLGIYYICAGNKDMATKITGLGATIGTVLGFFVLPALKPITQWIGKRNAQIASAAITFGAALILPFILSPAHPYWLMVPILVTIPLGTLNNTLTNAMVPDICDVDELDNGQRREGLFTSVMGFVAKLEISLCFLLVGYVLSWSGLDTKLAAQPLDVLHKLFWLCVIPNIAFTLIGLVLTIKFPVTPEAMAEVRRQLDERRLAKAAAGEPTGGA